MVSATGDADGSSFSGTDFTTPFPVDGNVSTVPAAWLTRLYHMGATYGAAGFKAVAAWNALAFVGTDYVATITLDGDFMPTTADADVGVARYGLFEDFNGDARPASGVTSGAVQRP
jgi:hypothetical protein